MAKPISILHWLPISLAIGGCGLHPEPAQPDVAANPATSAATRPFPVDTLYSLLVAETAVNRGQLDIALANYYQQAYQTRDSNVTRQGTLLAQHMGAAQAALDLALLWSDLDPENPEPAYLAGQYLIAFQRPDLAMQQSRRLLDLDAQTLYVGIASSPAAKDKNTGAQLLKEYRELLQQHPENIDLLLGQAALLESQGDLADSLTSIEKARDIDDKNLQARLFEVDILYKSGRPDKAIHRMADIIKDDPENSRLRLQYARLLSEQDLAKALEQFDYLARSNSMEPDLLLARAMANYQLNRQVEAQDQFEQLIFLKKYTDTAYFYMGEIARSNKKTDMAIEYYRRVEDGNEYLPAAVRSFDLLVSENKRMEGQQWLTAQRKSHPDLSIRLYLIEADVLLQQGDLARSLAALNEGIQKHPEQIELYYARSLILEKQGDTRSAETDLRFVLAAQPDNASALNALGYLLADNNTNLDEAYRLINKAQALRPEDPAIMDSMGWILYRQGHNEEAILRLQRAFDLDPNDEIAAHLGEVLWANQQQRDAESIWKKGLKIKPDSELIHNTRKRLQGS
ncbi:MAG TPA: tetratricopeptide repeat protein [Pseudomonadales bacterium]|nr:tetratricopeptide repeat protein [Pseudomonadales bacterium]